MKMKMKMNTRVRVVALLMVMEVLLMGATIHALDVCGVSSSDLMTCKPAVTPPTPSEPSEECCSVVSKADMQCLCNYKNSPLLPSLGIDPNLALQLPAKCQISNAPSC